MSKSPAPDSPPMPFGRVIKAMAILGALFLGFVVIAGSQKPRTEAPGLKDLARQVPGFRLVDSGAAQSGILDSLHRVQSDDAPPLPTTMALYIWPAECDRSCEAEANALLAALEVQNRFAPVIVRQMNRRQGQIWAETQPPEITALVDWAGELTALVGNAPRGVTIFYHNDMEIGRGRNIDWSSSHAKTLIQAL